MDVADETHDNAKSRRKKKKAEKRSAFECEQLQDDNEPRPSASSSKYYVSSPFRSLKEFRKENVLDSSGEFATPRKKKHKKHEENELETVWTDVTSDSRKHTEGFEQAKIDNNESTNHTKKKKRKNKNKDVKESGEEDCENLSKTAENALSGEELKESGHKSKHKKKKKKHKYQSNEDDLSVNGITLDMLDHSNAESISKLADKIANDGNASLRSSTPNPFFREDPDADVDDPLPVSKMSSAQRSKTDGPAQSKSKASSKSKRTKKPTGKQKAKAANTSLQSNDTSASVRDLSALDTEEDGSLSNAIDMDSPAVQKWLGSLEHDMVEEELDFEPPELHKKVPVLKGTSAKQKEELKNDGISIRLGKWSPKEDLIIKENLERFAKKYEVPAAHILLGINKHSREKIDSKLVRYLQLKKFSFQLAKNLPDRTLFSTYLRARKVFHPMPQVKLNKEQRSEMFRLKQTVGHKWNNISELMNIPAPMLREAARYHMEKRDTGQWTKEENEILLEAVQERLTLREDGSCRKLPWKKIARKVGTRNKGQCCKQWLHNLCWKFSHGNEIKPKWTDEDSYRLVEHLHQLDAETEADLDWDAICSKFSKSDSPSPKKAAGEDE